jgi:Methyltransferase FkbM domain
VAERSGQATLHVYPDAYNAWHSLARAFIHNPEEGNKAVAPEADLLVQAISLDDYCAEQGVERIDYLKIDVEGAELNALQGARGLLARGAVSVIQFEALIKEDSAPEDLTAVFACLEGHGYKCHPIGPGGKLLPPVSRTQAEHRNYAAIR